MKKFESPFMHDDEKVIMCFHSGSVWFETVYETLTEFDHALIIWAAKRLSEENPND